MGRQRPLEGGQSRPTHRLQETEPGSSRCPVREGTACLPRSPQRPDPGPELPNVHGQLPPHGPRAAPLSPARHTASKGTRGALLCVAHKCPRAEGLGRVWEAQRGRAPGGRHTVGGCLLLAFPCSYSSKIRAFAILQILWRYVAFLA